MKGFSFSAVILLLATISSCKKDSAIVDLNKGLIADFRLGYTWYDTASGGVVIHKVTAVRDRKGYDFGATYFSRADSSYIDFGDLPEYTLNNGGFTICFWALPDDTFPGAVISKRGMFGPWEFSIDNHFRRDAFNFDNWIGSGSGTVFGIDPLDASAPINRQGWHFYVFKSDGEKLVCYRDGKLESGEDVKNAGKEFSDTDAHLVIGNGGGFGSNYYFQGALDDIRIYNRAITDDEIGLLFRN